MHTPNLADLFARHRKAILAFSGGKDSLVCLHLCQDYRDQIEVVWVNTGAMFSHMEEFIRKATEGFNFVELKSDVTAWRKQFGDPVDVIPTFNSFPGHLALKPHQLRKVYQPWVTCCLMNRAQPKAEYIAKSDATLTIHGRNRADPLMRGFMFQSVSGDPVELCSLIAPWTDEDVFRYLAEHEIRLPHQYHADPPVMESLECWSCTRILHVGERFNYMRVHHPELYRQLKPGLLALVRAAYDATEEMLQVLGAVALAEKEDDAAQEVADTLRRQEQQNEREDPTDLVEPEADSPGP